MCIRDSPLPHHIHVHPVRAEVVLQLAVDDGDATPVLEQRIGLHARQRHLDTFAQESHNPLMSLVYADMLTAFRRIWDHAVTIAEIVGGEK